MLSSKTRVYSSILHISKRIKHWHSIENQYWQRSKIPTYHFQPSLPRLPIPKLEMTCDRYLASQRPLLTEEAFKKTEIYVTKFKNGFGKTLQEELIIADKLNNHTSYISEAWFDMYLTDRKPLPINYNPFLVYVPNENPEYNDQVIKVTNLLISSLRFYKSLKDNQLEPEVFHLNAKKSDTQMFRNLCSLVPSRFSWYVAYMLNAYPLDMSQYHNLFNSTRIPKMGKDIIYQDVKAKHVLVQRNGYFYMFDVLDENGNILPPENLLANFKTILNDPRLESEFPVGALTTMERNEWAQLRQHLLSLGNEKSISLIDSALFNICLDDIAIGDDQVALCRNYLHGDATNRWFDKSFSLIVTKDGTAGVNFEHSWGDGVAVLRYFQDIYKDSVSNPKVYPKMECNASDESSVCKIELNVDDKLKSAIKRAKQNYKSICDSLQMNVVILNGLGKKLCKQYQISPDAVMQLSFQDAYYKLTGKCTASYESCSTAAFKHGRTETIRPCTSATKAYSQALNSLHSPSKNELRTLIFDCSKVHGLLTREAAMGQGFDRHLFALRLEAYKMHRETPDIFKDSAYETMNHNIISTSTLSSPIVLGGGFGPVVLDGYGISYSMIDDAARSLVSYYPGSKGSEYAAALMKAYEDVLRILQ